MEELQSSDSIHIDAADIVSGTINTSRLASGTADGTTFLRGDQVWAVPAGGVTGFIASQNTTSPNNTVNASRLLVDAGTSNADIVLQPKGNGAVLAQLPDNSTTGGQKRAAHAVDLQTYRSNSYDVAYGQYSVVSGGNSNRASNHYAVVVGGHNNNSSGTGAVSGGGYNTTSGTYGASFGYGNNNSGFQSTAFGQYNTITNSGCLTVGAFNVDYGSTSYLFGQNHQNNANYNFLIGYFAKGDQQHVFSQSSGANASAGDSQGQMKVLRQLTNDTTPRRLTTTGNQYAFGSFQWNQIAIYPGEVMAFSAMICAKRTGANNLSAGWNIEGVIDNNGGTTAFVGTPIVNTLGDDSGLSLIHI